MTDANGVPPTPAAGPTITVGESEPIAVGSPEALELVASAVNMPGFVIADPRGWLELPSAHLGAILNMLLPISNRVRFQRADGGEVLDPLEALATDPEVRGNRDRAIELAINVCRDLPLATRNIKERIADFCRAAGHRQPRDLMKRIARIDRARQATEHRNEPMAEILRGAGAPADMIAAAGGCVVPSGWYFDSVTQGMVRADGACSGEQTLVLPGVPALARRYLDRATGTIQFEILWFVGGRVLRRSVARDQLLASSKLVQLAATGMPLSTNHAKLGVQYFSDYLGANEFRVSTSHLTTSLGWNQMEGEWLFQSGAEPISRSGAMVESIVLDQSDAGLADRAAAICRGGTPEESLGMLRQLSRYPVPWFAAVASLASILLTPLRVKGFIVDICGETSSGKTVTLQLCGSLWGSVDPAAATPSVVANWNSTRVSCERGAAFLQNLPYFLDESRGVISDRQAGQIAYDLANGFGRGRGNVVGIDATRRWNLVVISTGEQPLSTFEEKGGLYARIVTLRGAPFGDRNDQMRQEVDDLRRIACLNYGHIGPHFAKYVVDHQDEWAAWKDRHAAIERELAPTFGRNAVAGRHVSYLAVVRLTAQLMQECLNWPGEMPDPVDRVSAALLSEYSEIDRSEEAMQYVLDRVEVLGSHQLVIEAGVRNDCVGSVAVASKRPIGRDVRGRQEDANGWAIRVNEFDSILELRGFRPDEVKTSWMQRGWLLCDTDRRTKMVRVDENRSSPQRCVMIRAAVIDEKLGARAAAADESVIALV